MQFVLCQLIAQKNKALAGFGNKAAFWKMFH